MTHPRLPEEATHAREPAQHELLRFLNVRSAVAPMPSAGGRRIDFRSDATGVFQLFCIDERHPWPQQLTFGSERVQSADRSPDGRWIVFGTDVGGNERSQLHLLSPDGAVDLDLTRRPGAFHSFGCWSPDSRQIALASNRRHPTYFDALILDIDSGRTQAILEGESYFLPLCWSPDGERLIVWELQGSFDNNLYEVSLKTGSRRRLNPEEDDAAVRYSDCHYTADGRAVLLVTDRGREFLNVARLDLETLDLTWLTDEVWDVESLRVSADHRRAAVVVNVDGSDVLRIYDLARGFAEPELSPELPGAGISGVAFTDDAEVLALSLHGPRHNPDVWTLELATGALTQRTFSSRSGLDFSQFPTPEVVRYPSFDGPRPIPGLLYLPEGAAAWAGSLPVVVHVHGGPESQARAGFRWLVPYLVGRGYGVFTPNVRGSTGYGRTWAALDDRELRLDSVEDLVAAAEWLQELGPFDPAKVVVMGGSYGGYMTLAALSMYPDLWAAGIDIVGIANLRSFIANTGAYRRRWRILEYGDPDVIGEFMDRASPIHHAHRITAPLMVIHGANDPRVPQDEAEQIVAAVRGQGGDVEYLLYPDEGHGIGRLENRIHCYSRVVDFLDRHLKHRE